MDVGKSLPGIIWGFLKARKVWWIVPLIIILLFAIMVLIFGQGEDSPFNYALF